MVMHSWISGVWHSFFVFFDKLHMHLSGSWNRNLTLSPIIMEGGSTNIAHWYDIPVFWLSLPNIRLFFFFITQLQSTQDYIITFELLMKLSFI